MKKRLITPPTEEPISLEDAKLYLRVESSEEDGIIEQMVQAAREACEDQQNRCYLKQSWELYPGRAETFFSFKDPTPITAVQAVIYLLADGTEKTLAVSDYRVDTRSLTAPAELWITNPPRERLDPYQPMTIRVTAGVDRAEQLPRKTVQAMHLLLGLWYENREAWAVQSTGIKVPYTVEFLLANDRVY